MRKIINGAKELFFPKKCFFCKKYGTLLCDDCRSLLDISPVHRFDRTKKYLSDIYAPCSYENKRVKKIIHAFKYEPFVRELAAPLAKIIAGHFALCGRGFTGFALVPVPLAAKRWRKRGFNQAQALASELSKIWQAPIAANCLIKTRETQNQAELSQAQRAFNLRNAFAAQNKELLRDKKIFLIDDVATTGATMEECARVLLKNGAQEVIGAAIARTEN